MLGVNLVHTRNMLNLKHNLFSMKVNTGHETSGQQSSQINYSISQPAAIQKGKLSASLSCTNDVCK